MAQSAGINFLTKDILNVDYDHKVRPLESKSLDGAFRVHLPPEAFEQLGFKLGDVCQISESGVAKGYGLAWRATDRMGNSPKVKQAKLTDYLKTVLDVKDGSTVCISKTTAQLLPAAGITLHDVTPVEYGQTEEDVQHVRWIYRCGAQLDDCEAIAVGTTFDIYVRKGLRRRYCVKAIDSQADARNAAGLYCFGSQTKIEITSASAEPQAPWEALPHGPLVTTDRVGGLLDQLHALNDHLTSIIEQVRDSATGSVWPPNAPVLVHGYEGTGKSLILDQLGTAGFRKVFRIEKSMFTGSTLVKNQATIKSTFEAAVNAQPSLILLDDLDKLTPKGDDTYTEVLEPELRNLAETRVLVVAACRSPNDLNNALVEKQWFPVKVELPTPDARARKEILTVLLRDQPSRSLQTLQSLALRTHGFTGRDLQSLRDSAQRRAHQRWRKTRSVQPDEHSEQCSTQDNPGAAINGTPNNGTVASRVPATSGNSLQEQIEQEDWDTALLEIRPTALREVILEKPKVQWADIGGSQIMKQRFDEIIGWPIHHADKAEEHGVVPKKGVLLYGPPGCSKTLTAQAVASTYDLNFIAVQGAELISMYVGESERSIREIFRKARAAAPCVVFFDEIDSIASERDSGGSKGLNVLTTLLNEMDGFKALSNVLVLAATNKPQSLDPAIMRPGRFDAHVYLGPPSTEARREIFALSTRGLAVGDDVDFDGLVRETDGYTGAEVVQICSHAKDESLRRDIATGGAQKDLKMSDFVKAKSMTTRSVTEEMIESYKSFGGVSRTDDKLAKGS